MKNIFWLLSITKLSLTCAGSSHRLFSEGFKGVCPQSRGSGPDKLHNKSLRRTNTADQTGRKKRSLQRTQMNLWNTVSIQSVKLKREQDSSSSMWRWCSQISLQFVFNGSCLTRNDCECVRSRRSSRSHRLHHQSARPATDPAVGERCPVFLL